MYNIRPGIFEKPVNPETGETFQTVSGRGTYSTIRSSTGATFPTRYRYRASMGERLTAERRHQEFMESIRN